MMRGLTGCNPYRYRTQRNHAPRGVLANDVEALDALLDDDLVFTVLTGQVISKEDDLAAHRVKLLRLDTLDVIEMRASAVDEMILTTTRAALAGRFDGAAFTGTFAYTRLWRRSKPTGASSPDMRRRSYSRAGRVHLNGIAQRCGERVGCRSGDETVRSG